jgi:dCMP deaminase
MPTTARADYLTWDEFFMGMAFLSAQRSKDPSTQVGAVIVDDDNRILSIGYNGFPRGCPDVGPDALPWGREGEAPQHGLDTKYLYVVHAECNAILNKNTTSLKGSRLYVCLYPCNECSKMIIQSGIREVVYMSDKYASVPSFQASKTLLKLAGVSTRQYLPARASITIDFYGGGVGGGSPATTATAGGSGGGGFGESSGRNGCGGGRDGGGGGSGAMPSSPSPTPSSHYA